MAELKEKMLEFIATQADTVKEEWYMTDRNIASHFMNCFASHCGISLFNKPLYGVGETKDEGFPYGVVRTLTNVDEFEILALFRTREEAAQYATRMQESGK